MTVFHTCQRWAKALGRLRGIRTYEVTLNGCRLDRFPVELSRCDPHFLQLCMRFLLRPSSTCLRHACGGLSPGRMKTERKGQGESMLSPCPWSGVQANEVSHICTEAERRD